MTGRAEPRPSRVGRAPESPPGADAVPDEAAPGTERIGVARAAGLALATLVAMFGVVLLVNPGRYGPFGVLGGLVLIGAGAVGTVRFFRGPPGGEKTGASE